MKSNSIRTATIFHPMFTTVLYLISELPKNNMLRVQGEAWLITGLSQLLRGTISIQTAFIKTYISSSLLRSSSNY